MPINSKSKSEPQVRSTDGLAAAKREAAFYRQQLELICQDPRRTRARRLAESALTFWDSMQQEAAKRESGKAANDKRSDPAP